MKIWQKHLLSKLLKTFFFFLFCLFAIYIIIDLSAHGIRFFSKVSFGEIFFFYLYTFSSLLDFFFALSFLLATLRVLLDLSSHREILALQMAGISKKRLLFPFFYFAALLAIGGYINCQWFAPQAKELTSGFKTTYKAKQKRKEPKLFTVSFVDESELIYKSFDKANHELYDVFWVKNPSDVWHMKTFNIKTKEGKYTNHLTRNDQSQFEKTQSFISKHFSEIPLDNEEALTRFIPYENRPLFSLFTSAIKRPADVRAVFSHLYYKLVAPLIPLLVILFISPFTLRYTRRVPTFIIFALSIFALLGLKTIIDGMLILGENQVLPSYIAIFFPFSIVISLAMPSYVRMR